MGEFHRLAEDESLAGFLQQHEIVAIKVGAEHCRPCRAIDPKLPELASKLSGDVVVLDVDLDDHYEEIGPVLGQFTSVPMAFVCHGGTKIAEARVNNIDGLKEFFEDQLATATA